MSSQSDEQYLPMSFSRVVVAHSPAYLKPFLPIHAAIAAVGVEAPPADLVVVGDGVLVAVALVVGARDAVLVVVEVGAAVVAEVDVVADVVDVGVVVVGAVPLLGALPQPARTSAVATRVGSNPRVMKRRFNDKLPISTRWRPCSSHDSATGPEIGHGAPWSPGQPSDRGMRPLAVAPASPPP